MKHINFTQILFSSVLICFLFFTSCTENWNEHYDEDSFDLPDKTLKEYIQDKPDLSLFLKMMKITGYDKILNTSQSYTVWAPNNIALSGIDTTDKELVGQIVRNHIARSRFTTSDVDTQIVHMINGKNLFFIRKGSNYYFENINVVKTNIPAINGMIHIIDNYAPYAYNIWEYIGLNADLDSLQTYLYGQDQKVFDPSQSIEIGYDSLDQVIYDSVFILTNPVLEFIGDIDSEDSSYTAILPNNDAWSEAYNRIVGYLNFADDAGSTIRQRELSQLVLVKDMLFPGRINMPGSLDSLVSTTGNTFYKPSQIFPDKDLISLSNGMAYVVDQMPYPDTLSWFKEIRVEAEDVEGRSSNANDIYPRYSYGSGLDISDNKYILVDPETQSSSVTFSIPNTLSAKYNIYCVFVPATIVNPTDFTPSKATFKLTYISKPNGSTSPKDITPVYNITNPTEVTKLFVSQWDFQYANIINEDFDRVAVKLSVTNGATAEEEQFGLFTMTMRIDCIILEPVTE